MDEFAEDAGRITKILSHPTMPVTVTAGDDRKIRYFDNNTGKSMKLVIPGSSIVPSFYSFHHYTVAPYFCSLD